MKRIYNFSAGPAQLPEEVLLQVKEELLDWQGTGMSVMEMPHRGADFKKIALEAEQDLRDLLSIPDNYKVLFLQGGGRTQFAMVPMNLGANAKSLAYVNTGSWSKSALEEAKRYGKVHLAASSEADRYTTIPDEAVWDIPTDCGYLHYTDNETIQGLEFFKTPEVEGIPLISDMSSNLLSKPLEISKYGLIYACAQKNLGPAGVTIAIVRDDLLAKEPMPFTPTMLRYEVHAKGGSLYNTPPTFAWYVCGLVFKWVKKQGGVAKMAQLAKMRSGKIYQYIDQSDFYQNPVDPAYRSKMNMVFTLKDSSLEEKFMQEAAEAGLINLKGHRSVGGMRASMYNSMSQEGADLLLQFMQTFEKEKG